MIVLGYNGFTKAAELFRRHYGATGVDRHLLIGHDAAAALVVDGELVAAVEEERLSREKKTSDFPARAIAWCLAHAGLSVEEVDAFAFPWRFSRPVVEGMIEEVLRARMPLSGAFDHLRRLGELYTGMLGKEALHADFVERTGYDVDPNQLVPVPHHIAHAMCGYHMCGVRDAAFLVSDGRAEHASAIMGEIRDGVVRQLDQGTVAMSHSLALFYGKVTRYLGFVPNSDEYKVMGLAGYGEPPSPNLFLERLVELHEDGGYSISAPADTKACGTLFDMLFDGNPHVREDFDYRVRVAAAAQHLVETVTAHQTRALAAATGLDTLVFEGGLALNCVSNTKMLNRSPFTDMHVSFGASDPGVAIGAALHVAGAHRGSRRGGTAAAHSPYLGPSYGKDDLLAALTARRDEVSWREIPGGAVSDEVAKLLLEKNVVGWFQGAVEYGPRALGNRSILANPQHADIKDVINVRVKRREPFRPFAPVVLEEAAPSVFEMGKKATSPYMTFVFPVRREWRERIPGACHVDGTARIQTVNEQQNPELTRLLRSFAALTGVPCLVNTSFNLAGEPVVASPEDALTCFLRTEIDYLVLGDLLVRKLDSRRRARTAEAGGRPPARSDRSP
ncbi:carbamoyltransferase [Streptomyces sp. MAR4 CNX-425]|uniref:carbamoyltransferase family protein n=1 Tax=Streptomyces sp. MAR4 CNX-425 TaxID=3406343 RepID=UPI003B514550